jgi:hypothetical protein
MLTFLIHSRTAWNDYFEGTFSPNLNSQTYTSRQTPSGTNVYVSNCLFKFITSTDHGGALYCTSETNFLVESTFFFSCKTSAQFGGAIYFENSAGQSVLYNVCGYDCCSTHSNAHYLFAYIGFNNAVSSKNYVNYSSISRCVTEKSDSYYPLNLKNGKICCPSVNISLNKCYGRSGIYCYPTLDSNSIECSFSYSSFADNIATYHTCILLDRDGAKYEIKSCNILRNTQGTLDTWGTIRSDGSLMIEDSCILENKATNIFYQANANYRTTLSNCTVDKTTNNGYLTTQNTVTKSFILALNHMSNLICHAEYDSAGTLTPITQTPSPSKKQRLYYTYFNCFNQPQLTFASTFIFLFHFIHSSAYNNL